MQLPWRALACLRTRNGLCQHRVIRAGAGSAQHQVWRKVGGSLPCCLPCISSHITCSYLGMWRIKLIQHHDPEQLPTKTLLSPCQNHGAHIGEHPRNGLPVVLSVLFHPNRMLITGIRTYCGGGSYFWMPVKIH